MKRLKSDGFTIVELMIATAVFSIILLTISAAVIQIGRLYYKGITAARTQEIARSVMTTMSQTVQFTAGQITTADLENAADSSIKGMCIGTYSYSYKLGQQRTGNNHALVMNDTLTSCAGTDAQFLTGTVQGKELLGEGMRLTKFSVVKSPASPTAYTVTVGIIYADDDLLCVRDSTDPQLSCTSGDTVMTPTEIKNNVADLACKTVHSGSEFCAASELSTIVERRLQQ